MGRHAVMDVGRRAGLALAAVAVLSCAAVDPAEACRRTSFPACAQLYGAGNNCVRLVNNCNFAVRWHENLGGCNDETHWLAAFHNTIICGNNCRLRGVTMC